MSVHDEADVVATAVMIAAENIVDILWMVAPDQESAEEGLNSLFQDMRNNLREHYAKLRSN